MHDNLTHKEVLTDAIEQAKRLMESPDPTQAIEAYKRLHTVFEHPVKTKVDGQVVDSGSTVAEAITTLINNLDQTKYLFSMVITGLVEKLVQPAQDITLTQAHMQGGYSNRSSDERWITPMLKEYGLTAMAVSGAESGRNFERPQPHDLDFSGNPRGKGNKIAYLGIIHAVQNENVEPFPIIVLLCTLDLIAKKVENEGDSPVITGLSIDEIVAAVVKHHSDAKGNGRARLPVLAIQAVYQCLVVEVARYKHTILRNPPNRHTANDKMDWIGDIQVDRENGSTLEGVEVKSERHITVDMVREVIRKVKNKGVERYYILSTKEPYIQPENRGIISEMVARVRQETGCHVIVNGLNSSLWYYLRLLQDPNDFVNYYTEQVKTDPDVKSEHRQLWYAILNELNSSSK